MAFLGRYGSVSPAAYDEMTRDETLAYAHQVARLRSAEIDLFLNLARFVAGARVGGGPAQEVR